MNDLSEGDELDKQISASVKKVLLSRITFKDATRPDRGDNLHKKYKPLNAMYKPGQNANQIKSSVEVNGLKTPADSSEMPHPPVILFSLDDVEMQWKQIRRVGAGLTNMGNTCFLNSVIQVLTYTPPLVNYLMSDKHKSKCNNVGFCMQCELMNHFMKVLRPNANGGAIRPMSIIEKLKCIGKHFRFGRQEDAHEFLRYTIEGIQKSCLAGKPKLDKLSKETTAANAIFGGHFRSQVKCLQCHHESNTYDPMMDINLDIKECSNIVAALQRSVRPDRLDGANKYNCERCRKKTVAQKRGTIHREPNVLTLQLKRFDFSGMFGGKISKPVKFPELLDVRPFMSVTQGSPVLYKLYGVLVHSGYSCNSGHYYCYVKAPNGTWYEMNDAMVHQVGLHTVLDAQAYLLFYIRTEKRAAEKVKKPPVVNTNSASSTNKRPENYSATVTSSLSRPQVQAPPSDKIGPLGVAINRKEPKINWTPGSVSFKLKNKEQGTPSSKNVLNATKSSPANMPTLITAKSTPKPIITSSPRPQSLGINKSMNTTIGITPIKRNPSLADVTPLVSTDSSILSNNVTKSPKKEAPPAKDVTVEKPKSNVSGLQSLSENYESSDSPDGSDSPRHDEKTPTKQDEEKISKENKTPLSIDISEKPGNDPVKVNGIEAVKKKGTTHSPTQHTHDYLRQFNPWIPITKASLVPRIVMRMSDGEKLKRKFRSRKSRGNDDGSSTCSSSSIRSLASPSPTKDLSSPPLPSTPSPPPPPPVEPVLSPTKAKEESNSYSSVTLPKVEVRINPVSPVTVKESATTQESIVTENEDSNSSWQKKKKKKKKKKRKYQDEEEDDEMKLVIDESSRDGSVGSPSKRQRLNEYVPPSYAPNRSDGDRFPSATSPNAPNHGDSDASAYLKKSSIDVSEELSPKQLKKLKKRMKKEKRRLSQESSSSVINVEVSITKKKKKKKKHKRKHGEEDSLPEYSISPYKSSLKESFESKKSKECERPTRYSSKFYESDDSKSRSSSPSVVHHIEESGKRSSLKSVISRDSSPALQSSRKSSSREASDRSSRDESRSRSSSRAVSPDVIDDVKDRDWLPQGERSSGKKRKKSRQKKYDTSDSETEVREERKSRKSRKDVPTHVWDEKPSISASWDGSTKSDTLDALMKGGAEVKTWGGEDSSLSRSLHGNEASKEQAQDEWDMEYDAGKVKKTKKHQEETTSSFKRNPFQAAHDNNKYNKGASYSKGRDKWKHGNGRKH